MSQSFLPVVLAPLSWLRGDARNEGGMLVLDRTGAEEYELQGSLEIVQDLSALKTLSDMLAFTRRYGLLKQAPNAPRADPDAWKYQESVVEWEQEVRGVQSCIALASSLAKAMHGEPTGFRELRAFGGEIATMLQGWPEEDEHFIEGGRALLQVRLRDHIATLALEVAVTIPADNQMPTSAPSVPRVSVMARPNTLLECAWTQLSILLMADTPVANCSGCGRPFLKTHPRQDYCTPQCSQRHRYRRYLEKRKEAK